MKSNSIKLSTRFLICLVAHNLIMNVAALTWPLARILIVKQMGPSEHPLMNKEKDQLFLYNIWWPTDARQTPTYFYLAAWTALSLIVQTGAATGSNIFLSNLMVCVSKRAEFLKDTATIALANGPSFKKVPLRMRQWIRYHQYYISLVHKINLVCGFTVMLDHICSIYRLVHFGYILTNFSTYGTSYYTLVPISNALFNLLVQALAGQQVINKCVELNKTVVRVANNNLRSAEGQLRNTLKTLKARCSCGVVEKITGVDLFVVSVHSLFKEISLVVSVLLVVSQLG
ncbi:uncharacterized protein LOC132201178 isoform X2 [Neocloeon triangulifer]|nr:uncharacterized protein LOC132201178 isoform X2 [Neocloeon triangulifer]XP_059483122.1 uncharacterized protein LOC132201178 isoform X2 [Neocloeon triangulifer]